MWWMRRKLPVWGSWSKQLMPMLIQRFLALFTPQMTSNLNNHGPRTPLLNQLMKQHTPQLLTHPFKLSDNTSLFYVCLYFTCLFKVCLGSPGCGDRTMILIFFLFTFGLIFLWSLSCGDWTMVLFYLFPFALIGLLLSFNIFVLRIFIKAFTCPRIGN